MIEVFPILLLGISTWQVEVPYCEVTVSVKDPLGVPAEGWVTLRRSFDPSGLRVRTQKGVAELCDVGYGVFSVEVAAAAGCPTVTITNLQYWYLNPLTLKVVLPSCTDKPMLPPNGCPVILRIRNEHGEVPTGGRLKGVPRQAAAMRVDKLGRNIFWLDYGETAEVTAEAEGYLPETWTVRCEKGKPYVEKTVTLSTR
jgi:hypothetical protein